MKFKLFRFKAPLTERGLWGPSSDMRVLFFQKLKFYIIFAVAFAMILFIIFRDKPTLAENLPEQESILSNSQISFQGSIRPLTRLANLNEDKITLGRDLFQDKRLSKNQSVSCMSCHDLQHAGVDGRQFSVGINGSLGNANTPTVFNSVYNFKQFWDGRAENLEEQIDGPIQDSKEMGATWSEVVEVLKQDANLVARFQEIYKAPITASSIKDSIVEFEKTLVTLNSPFDKYLAGDSNALSETQISGYKKFTTYGCVSCHQGQNIGGNMFQTLGIAADYFKDRGGSYPSDLGRYNVTKLESDKHVFKVPSLRNVALTAPYFHDGSSKTLSEAVHNMAKYQLGRQLSKNDIRDIVEFLTSLTGETPDTVKFLQRDVSNEK